MRGPAGPSQIHPLLSPSLPALGLLAFRQATGAPSRCRFRSDWQCPPSPPLPSLPGLPLLPAGSKTGPQDNTAGLGLGLAHKALLSH